MSATTAGERSAASARLGLTLRRVLTSPREGFATAARALHRRERSEQRLPEGVMPYVLAALGGCALMLLWLKLGALAGLRDVPTAGYRWQFLVVALVAGALLALFAQVLWSFIASLALTRDLGARHLRLIWGAASFPNVFALLVLLPLDLAVVGRDSFTSERLTDPLTSLWAALSIAVALSLAAWWLLLLYKGVEAATGARLRAALVGPAAGVATLVLLAAASAFGLRALAGI